MAESQNIEWKESWRDEYLKWICGFANAQGGRIYIGTKDDGTVVGVRDSKKLLEEIPNKIQTTMGIVADVNLLTQDGRDYIEIVVSPSSYPVNYKGEFHYRSGSTKQQLKGIALNEFLSSKSGIRWEDVIVPGVTADDLDKESFDIFRREALRSKRMTKEDLRMTNEELLDSLKLMTEWGLKRAAVMLFHRNPEKWIPGCYTKIGKFGTGSDLQYQDEVHGSLFIQADRIVDLIYLKYLKAPITYDNMTRVETYPFAKAAVREAVYNALIHSCWSSGVPIQIRIEDDAMYISNDCVFPSDWTVESLMKRHRSRPYNPCIANAFFRAGYVEVWGRGIQKICETCEAYGTEPPEYDIHSEDIMLKLPALRNAVQPTQTTQSPIQSTQSPTQTSDGTRDDQSLMIIGEFTDTEQQILQLIKEHPEYSQRDMALSLGWELNRVKYYLTKFRKAQLIKHIGTNRLGYWEILRK
ncbi:MAG: putative DNA binding domain-containing protein [Clostridiales bacterium]|nr:putative DNA binding domain-containing protein [Clostridiales bacterium]